MCAQPLIEKQVSDIFTKVEHQQLLVRIKIAAFLANISKKNGRQDVNNKNLNLQHDR